MPRYPNAASVFVIPVKYKDGVPDAVLLSEQDLQTRELARLFEPALDAFGGKRDPGEDCAKTAVREVWEESGKLIRDEHLQALRDWIAAQPEDSAHVYWDEGGRAVFFFYPIPCAATAFWYKLHETFAQQFGYLPYDRTRKRSPTRLHWVKADAYMHVKHVCAPDCAERCGRDVCITKTLGVKAHVKRALQCLQARRQTPPAPLPPPPPPPQQQQPVKQPMRVARLRQRRYPGSSTSRPRLGLGLGLGLELEPSS